MISIGDMVMLHLLGVKEYIMNSTKRKGINQKKSRLQTPDSTRWVHICIRTRVHYQKKKKKTKALQLQAKLHIPK